MSTITRFVGLDVHKDTIAIAMADEGASPAQSVAEIANDTNALLRQLRRLGKGAHLAVCYEAGPTGFGLSRTLAGKKIACTVVAPSMTPVRSGDRIKTDRRDARNLAGLFRSSLLTAVHVPDETTEAMRDLTRAREAAKNAERAARQQLGKFLLRHGRIFRDGQHWTKKHLEWIGRQRFDHEAQRRVLADCLHAVEEAGAREARLAADLAELSETWCQRPLVDALMGFRGIQRVTAVTLVAELDDLLRFSGPRGLMAYLGLVPSERSSGQKTRRGSITKAGNGHVRRALVESAWAYRYPPRMSRAIRRRNQDLTPRQRAIAWSAQVRLHGRYVRLKGRGKNGQQTVTAIARELAGFVWAMAQTVPAAQSTPRPATA